MVGNKKIESVGRFKAQVFDGATDKAREQRLNGRVTIMFKESLITKIRRRYTSVLKSKAGQSTTEYILILAIVVMIAGKLKDVLSTKVVGTVDRLNFDRVLNDQ